MGNFTGALRSPRGHATGPRGTCDAGKGQRGRELTDMLNDVITGSIAELLGGCAVFVTVALVSGARRRRGARRSTAPGGGGAATRPARTYTLIGTRAPDGHVVQLASSRPAGTVITWPEPASDRRQRFELTDAVLSDGTYAAEPLDWYR
ncbi:hypothetical protein SVEN_5722 [Streptomyces venezuelae ATCC 10712]|uniref:Uncharacterized protein n=2 Tax=Streptomyces TaxID=1883 RepID=F2R9G5_STRVP|nr:hypothetical protein SVEN_5722 [Streptomyces venezuelae ATCC 10712]